MVSNFYDFINKNKKGQLSIEFILIILVVLIIIETIILPLRDYSQSSFEDISSINYLENTHTKINNVLSDFSTYSEGRTEFSIYVPEDSNLYFSESNSDLNLFYSYNLKSNDIDYKNCDVNACFKEYILSNIAITNFEIIGPKNTTLILEKNSLGIKLYEK